MVGKSFSWHLVTNWTPSSQAIRWIYTSAIYLQLKERTICKWGQGFSSGESARLASMSKAQQLPHIRSQSDPAAMEGTLPLPQFNHERCWVCSGRANLRKISVWRHWGLPCAGHTWFHIWPQWAPSAKLVVWQWNHIKEGTIRKQMNKLCRRTWEISEWTQRNNHVNIQVRERGGTSHTGAEILLQLTGKDYSTTGISLQPMSRMMVEQKATQ